MSTDTILDLVEQFCNAEQLVDGHAALRSALRNHGLDHVAYAAINLPAPKNQGPLIAVTYAIEWQQHYLRAGYVNIDPIVQTAMGGVLPVDWGSIGRSDQVTKRFFGEAQEFGIGSDGLSFPVRGQHGEFALFSVTSALPHVEWQKLKKEYARDFMILAYYFHSWAMKKHAPLNSSIVANLSVREKDCLRWRAMGKSDWEISQILAISERTVKFHLECARTKLGAVNTTHAVASAISRGLMAF